MGKFTLGTATFVNPYNFVNVDWEKTDREDIQNTVGNLSGVINCKLYAVTPVSLPDTEQVKEDAKKHKTYPFMRTPDGKLMIPGSSLRGAIRSVYETVTGSCFVTSNENQVITRRAGMRECGKPYLLYKTENGWELHEAVRHLIIIEDNGYAKFDKNEFKKYVRWNKVELNKHRYGEPISFTPGNMYTAIKKKKVDVGPVVKDFKGTVEGYLYKGEVPLEGSDIKTNKHFESIFVESENGATISVSQEQVNALKDIYKQYNDPSVNRLKTDDSITIYEGALELLNQLKQPIPIWYSENTKQLSLASIGRIAYQKRMGDMLYTKKPCNSRRQLCRACQLFGTANGDGKVGSRLRITDAVASDANVIKNVTLKELGSPHISFEKFYIEGKSYDDAKGKLRGRKYYWHNIKEKAYEVDSGLENQGKTERNATMELADKGSEFSFDVFFDGITIKQLEELKWVLTLGENTPSGSKCYKIGRGKPIGLGSVKISIDSIQRREFDISAGIYKINQESVDENIACPESLESKAVEDILKIMDTDITKGKNISYPFIENARENDNKTAPHNWFSELKDSRSDNNQEWQSIKNALDNPFKALKNGGAYSGQNIAGKGNKSSFRNYTKGQRCEGTVIGDNNGQGSILKVRLKEGGTAFVYFRDIKEKKVQYGEVLTEYPEDTPVTVTYEGKKEIKGTMKDSWSIR